MMHTTIADFPARLEAFLADLVGGEVEVRDARHLAGGASRDTWAVDLEVRDGPEAGRHALVLRRDLGGEIDDSALSRAEEFAVLLTAHRGGVMVPRPRWLCPDGGVLGTPFFLMDRLGGEAIGRRVVREESLAGARLRLPAELGEQLARIHALDAAGLSFLPRHAPGESPALEAVARATRQLESTGEPHPVLELALRWLRTHAPACEAPVLVHGDFRVGNLMVLPSGLAGVFDWEFAHVGDPHEDLAWPCVRSWRFGRDEHRLGGVGDPAPFFATYEKHAERAVDRGAVRYWEVMGNLRWAVGCLTQARRHLSGRARSVELASLGRKAAEMELELLDLIEKAG